MPLILLFVLAGTPIVIPLAAIGLLMWVLYVVALFIHQVWTELRILFGRLCKGSK